MRRAGERCEQCGRTKAELKLTGIRLEVHHRDGDRHNNTQENLSVLCETCHPRDVGGSRKFMP